MPIENEQKYVLLPHFPENALPGWEHVSIRQGYLDDGPRIWQFGGHYVFTYKRWLADENAQIEIETALSQKDFERLWPLCTVILTKDRYIKQVDDLEWVVDFLKDDHGKTYFTLAEVEMPEHMDKPIEIIPEISEFIIHAPEKGDKNYSNKRLADQGHARSLLERLDT